MDDKQLVGGILQGNRQDFRKIVDAYTGAAMALALNILSNRDDAEDACQEAFIQVYRNLHHFDMSRSFKTWFYTILYRRCLDQLKRRRRARELVSKVEREPSLFQPQDPEATSEPRYVPSHLLERLNPKERTALCLWANDGYTAQEISEVLRCSASTARVYLFQARKKIKRLLEKKNASLPDY
jgi:RNA polymerase sigma-70 factor (ECF subfamily)